MTYQVLARKWRPKSFAEVVGQEHILQTLANALTQKRLHHAYLFTGTRGVGKTTLARILAKCFNCEAGISAVPCGQCNACLSIDNGKFIDLYEIDAASKTKVEDMRDILSNVQYTPSIGRYKIYLIDEVHMLSTHSFNALLKTLEEPPEHVKFLLATTDKDRLPITILSRCLQFNLKNIPVDKIQTHLQNILVTEGIKYDEGALRQLARAAQGSVRDALSLLDQAIAYGSNEVKKSDVEVLLGTIPADKIFELCKALVAADIKKVFVKINELGDLAADFTYVLDELLTILQRIALLQAAPDLGEIGWDNLELLQNLAQGLSPEDIQLYYQIGLIGKRDIFLAPSLLIGFEMVMLRMLAFHPSSIIKKPEVEKKQRAVEVKEKVIDEPREIKKDVHLPREIKSLISPEEWLQIFMTLKLTGTTQALIQHCAIGSFTDEIVELLLEPSQAPLLNGKHEERLAKTFSDYFNRPISVVIKIGDRDMTTLASLSRCDMEQKQEVAQKALKDDPNVKILIDTFDAKVVGISEGENQKL
jgi:DNA polymerase III subunit gamma/tau